MFTRESQNNSTHRDHCHCETATGRIVMTTGKHEFLSKLRRRESCGLNGPMTEITLNGSLRFDEFIRIERSAKP